MYTFISPTINFFPIKLEVEQLLLVLFNFFIAVSDAEFIMNQLNVP